MKTDKTTNLKRLLKKTKGAPIDREFLASLRENLAIYMEANPPTEIYKAQPVYAPLRFALKPAVLLLLVFALTASGAVFASRNSLPGDALYPIKILSERANVAASLSPESRVKTQLLNAETRVKEFSALVEKNSALPTPDKERFHEAAEKAIDNFNTQVSNSLEETSNLKKNNNLERALKIENDIHSAISSYGNILSDTKEKNGNEIEEINQFIDSNNRWNATTGQKPGDSDESKDGNAGKNESKNSGDQNKQSKENEKADKNTSGKSGKDSSGNDNRSEKGGGGRDGKN